MTTPASDQNEPSKMKKLISGNTDAVVLKSAALDLGIDPNRIVIEDKAKDTAQQAIEIKRIVKNDRIILVTSAIHMPRSMALFNKQGIQTVPAPADFYIRHSNLESAPSWGGFRFYPTATGGPRADALVHEYVGMLWAKVWGQI